MAAQDGQTLDQQSPETQAAFQAAYGGNAASAWEGEHDAAIGASNAPAAVPSAPATAPQTAGAGQTQLGLATRKTAATLTGPAEWIRATNYARGVQQTNLPDFINRLLTGQGTAALGGPAPGTSMSSPQSMINLANQVSGVGGGST